jgi:HAE1 family hydrophobic/amphiphilic exporter-1
MAVGVFALLSLPVERYPDVQMGEVLITTMYPGASPKDVESLVTQEIENALDDLESVEYIRSSSYRGRSSIIVKFIDDSDYQKLFSELRLKVLGNMNELPEMIDPPEFDNISVSLWLPTVMVNLIGERSNSALNLMAEEMKIQLRSIPGVKEVTLSGDYTREFHVILDPSRMDELGVTFDETVKALNAANIVYPAGDALNETGEFVIVVDERFRTRQDIAEVVIRKDSDGSFVRVEDVLSRANLNYRDPFIITSVNGMNCVSLKIIKNKSGNILDIVPNVLEVVDHFQDKLAKEGVQVVLTQDQRVYVDESITTLGNNLLVGIILVSLIIWSFMGFRNAVLAMVGIPFSFLLTMIFMWATGNSLNEISLFAFVLVSGIIVDDAIVVVENIYRHLQEGESLQEAVVNGTSEVTFPVIAATSTTVAAFLPMLIMTGSTGEFFAQIPIAITAAIAASLFECLIILPLHFQDWPGKKQVLRTVRYKYTAGTERPLMAWVRRGTNRIVAKTLRFRWTTLFLVFFLFFVSLGIMFVSFTGKFPLIRVEFYPADYTYYYIELEGPVGTALETTSEKLKEVSSFLLPNRPDELQSITAMAGFFLTKDYRPVFGSNVGHLLVELPQKGDRNFTRIENNDPSEHLNNVLKKIDTFVNDDWSVRVRPEESGPPTGKDISVRIVGPNPEMVTSLARNIEGFLQKDQRIAPHIVGLSGNRGRPTRVYRFLVEEKACAEYGLTPTSVAALAGSVLDGRYLGKFRTADEEIDLKVLVDQQGFNTLEQGLSLPLIQHPSGPVRLKDVVRVQTSMEPNKLNRYQNNRSVTLTADIRTGAPLTIPQAVQLIRAHHQEVKRDYPGAEISFSGEFESTRRSYQSLTYAFVIAVLVIYMILANQFKSYLQPLIILSAIVFSMIGVIFGKFLTQSVFTVNSFIALLGVTGVVVNDSLVLIDFINKRFKTGMSRREAIIDGIRVRLRPILLTTLTTTLGLAPMALGIPSYSITWGTMASTFVTGLCTATFLTLFVVPIEWDLLMGFKQWWDSQFGRD